MIEDLTYSVERERQLRIAKHLSSDMQLQQFFGMDEGGIFDTLMGIVISDDGFDLSPNFQSPGWGQALREPLVKVSDLGNLDATLAHEMKHGLHYGLCKRLFEGEDRMDHFGLFKTGVLQDQDFVIWNRSHGDRMMLAVVHDLVGWGRGIEEVIGRFSWLLGALTYQHAYFVDSGMCEAVASFRDSGVLNILHQANRYAGLLFIPGEDPLEGYANERYQELFRNAGQAQKALLVRKIEYSREGFFTKKVS